MKDFGLLSGKNELVLEHLLADKEENFRKALTELGDPVFGQKGGFNVAFNRLDGHFAAIPLLVFREFPLLPNSEIISSERKLVRRVNNLMIKSGERNDPFMAVKGYITHHDPFEKKMRNKYVFAEIQDSQFDYANGNPRLPALGAMLVRSQDEKYVLEPAGDTIASKISIMSQENAQGRGELDRVKNGLHLFFHTLNERGKYYHQAVHLQKSIFNHLVIFPGKEGHYRILATDFPFFKDSPNREYNKKMEENVLGYLDHSIRHFKPRK